MSFPPLTTVIETELIPFTGELDVIAVGAHPDDVEIAIGGTLATLVNQGFKVGIVDLTDGEPTPVSPGTEIRLQEAKRAAELLGVHYRTILPLPNRRLFDSFEARILLAKVFRKYRPKLVLGIAGKTAQASPDHWQAMQITDAAVFYSKLTKWDSFFDNHPVHTIKSQAWFPLGLRNLNQASHENALLVDISDTLEQKIAAVKAYETQFPPSKGQLFDMLSFQNKAWGASAGLKAAEIIYPTVPLATKNLMQTLFLSP